MNINKKIFQAFNTKPEIEWDNEYKPNIKIQSTINAYPYKRFSFNEISRHINNELKKLK